MIEAIYSTFVARTQVKTTADDYDCYAYETKDGKYYLAYHNKSDNDAYLANEPIEKDKIEFIGEKQIFVHPFMMITDSKIVK